MWCVQCQKDLGECTCPDLPERLKAIGASGHMVLTWCSGCGEYWARCKCPDPKPILEQRIGDRVVGTIERG